MSCSSAGLLCLVSVDTFMGSVVHMLTFTLTGSSEADADRLECSSHWLGSNPAQLSPESVSSPWCPVALVPGAQSSHFQLTQKALLGIGVCLLTKVCWRPGRAVPCFVLAEDAGQRLDPSLVGTPALGLRPAGHRFTPMKLCLCFPWCQHVCRDHYQTATCY